MPQKQTIIWTALPNGLTSGGDRLRLSVFVSPRLETDQGLPRPQLAQFPDFLTWAAKSKGIQFTVKFGSASPVQATRVGAALEPELWAALFKETTYVEPYVPEDLTARPILSHPVKNIDTFVKAQYQSIAAASPSRLPAENLVLQHLSPVSLYDEGAAQQETAGRTKTTAQTGAKSARKVSVRPVVMPSGVETFVRNLQPSLQPSAKRSFKSVVRQPLQLKSSAVEAFQSVYKDLQQYKAIRTAKSQPARDFLQVRLFHPEIVADFPALVAPEIDFHKMVSSLGNYPELMRRLGLVVDLEVPIPSGGSDSTVQVIPAWTADAPPSSFSSDFIPRTAYTLDTKKKRFSVRKEKGGADIENGLLDLSDDDSYPIVHVDIDGTALKLVSTADRLVSTSIEQKSLAKSATATASSDAPADKAAGLPALRTSGISVAHTDRAVWLAGIFAKTALYNKAVLANAPDQVTFYADDIIRGYRVDIWDLQSKSWHSLCQRKGTYNFFEAGVTRQYDDEGFIQLAVTESATTSSSEAEGTKDLYLHESMFSWDGWSLCAPRPGKTVASDGSVKRLDDPEVAKTRATSEFKMVASFTPVPGSLPRLRFGASYRMRARVVDLAGNSLALDEPDPSDFSKATETHLYTRFEPVVAPLAVLTKTFDGTKSPGESLYRPVIRSNFDKTAQDYASTFKSLVSDANYTEYAARLFAPPKTSQLMAERHSLFDASSGAMKKDQATYAMISSKADGAFMLDPLTRLPMQPNLEIPYLPDPLSRGASFSLLDAKGNVLDTVPSVSFYPSGSLWPDSLPFLLKVWEGTGKISWDWDEKNRTLNVRLPKAEVATFEVSSILGDGDLGTRNQAVMGVLNWVQQAKPSNLSQIRQAAGLGRFWLATPSREIVLVHAVQQPLIAPGFHSLTPDRDLGETYSYIADDQPMAIDGKSTIKVDVEAAWDEPVDDVSDANGPKVINSSTHVREWKLSREDTSIYQAISPITVTAPITAVSPSKGTVSISKKKEVTTSPLANKTLAPSQVKEVSNLAIASSLTTLKPGVQIPADLRMVRTPAHLEKIPKFGYSWRHAFGDTKYRKVNYTAIATTRFAEYFPIKDTEQLTRKSPAVAVDVPNSARPPIPQVLYVVPTFGWQKKTEVRFDKSAAKRGELPIPGLKGVGTISQRLGGGLRVYLDRPWYASGDGELLGVVFWPSPVLTSLVAANAKADLKAVKSKTQASSPKLTATFAATATGALPETLRPLVTQWGMDPIWLTNPLPGDLPEASSFKNTAKTGAGLTLAELDGKQEPSTGYYKVGVAGYKPEYDKDRQLWYCDIEIDPGLSYFPFIRLALARYQPISVEGAHLSRVILADFAQLAPDRTATLVYDPKNLKRLDVAVTGLTYGASIAGRGPSEMEVTVESRAMGADENLGWVPVPEGTIPLKTEGVDSIPVWRAQVRLDKLKVPKLHALRLVIREYELFLDDTSSGQKLTTMAAVPARTPVRRLVYADVLSVPPSL